MKRGYQLVHAIHPSRVSELIHFMRYIIFSSAQNKLRAIQILCAKKVSCHRKTDYLKEL
jgi:hypothetical protein